jgi:hypothetical protein
MRTYWREGNPDEMGNRRAVEALQIGLPIGGSVLAFVLLLIISHFP